MQRLRLPQSATAATGPGVGRQAGKERRAWRVLRVHCVAHFQGPLAAEGRRTSPCAASFLVAAAVPLLQHRAQSAPERYPQQPTALQAGMDGSLLHRSCGWEVQTFFGSSDGSCGPALLPAVWSM